MRLLKRTRTVELSWSRYRSLKKRGRLSGGSTGFLILFGMVCFFPAVPELMSQADWLNDWMPLDALRWLCVFLGLCSIGVGVSRLWLRLLLFRSRRLIAQDALSEELSADAETLDAVMRKRRIQPRLILNGQRFYKRSDFGAMPLLLRPSQAPPPVESLLLLPAPADREAQTENLLRPVADAPLKATVYENLISPPPPLTVSELSCLAARLNILLTFHFLNVGCPAAVRIP